MKQTILLIIACLLPTLANAQTGQPDQHQRREQLEAQIVQRFLNHVSNELQLDGAHRGRLEQHLRQTASSRRSLAQNAVQLRGQLLRASRDENTPDADFRRLIDEMTRLREQEASMWKSDQDALSRILTPRQHARFIVMWIRFNDQVRDMAMRRGGMPGPPQRRP